MEHFKKLSVLNINQHTEKKQGLTYLSWAWAWAEVKKAYPDAEYEIVKFDNKPYLKDDDLGYMVFTRVTIENLTHEMFLPVLDGANKPMKSKAYTYSTKYKDKTCEACNMFDINKSIMRCLTKNLAMFGLGLYLYAGEDLPEVPKENLSIEHEKFISGVQAVKEKKITQTKALEYLKQSFELTTEIEKEFKNQTK